MNHYCIPQQAHTDITLESGNIVIRQHDLDDGSESRVIISNEHSAGLLIDAISNLAKHGEFTGVDTPILE